MKIYSAHKITVKVNQRRGLCALVTSGTEGDGEKMGIEMRLERMKIVCVFNIMWPAIESTVAEGQIEEEEGLEILKNSL